MNRPLKWILRGLAVLIALYVAIVFTAFAVSLASEPIASAAVVQNGIVSVTAVESTAGIPAPDRPTIPPEPSATLRPTDIARPSNTPRPTSTVKPLPTSTARASATPRPTNTPRPTATRIPPTAMALPTRTPVPPTATAVPTAALPGDLGQVTHIVDGDTIDVSINGSVYRVRYIGMDTPERGDSCATEATTANANLVWGQTVRLVRDVSETDRFDRLLRYVYVGDTFVNGALVSAGWAIAKDYPPDTAMSAVLHSLESGAPDRSCAIVAAATATIPSRAPAPIPIAPVPTQPPQPLPTWTPQPVVQPTAAPPSGNCDPSYPTVCIPPAPPDLDCGDIPFRRFTVLPPDPHGFDGNDHDGIGCESG